MDNRPVGLFDSGVGGLTVFEQVVRIMPRESVVYFGDTAHVPYGGRSTDDLVQLGDRIIRFLLTQNVKCVIFACNTSSSVSIGILRERYPVPMIGLVEPGAKAAVKATVNKRIGLLATEATVKSGSYPKAIAGFDPGVKVFSEAAPLLVPLVETGRTDTYEAKEALAKYLTPLKQAGIDTLILGCTHYPFFKQYIADILGSEAALVDPAEATVIEAQAELSRRGMLAVADKVRHDFFVSGDAGEFNRLAGRLCSGLSLQATRVDI
ncbi:MAG: glutamate racemase [Bacillota bacterium]